MWIRRNRPTVLILLLLYWMATSVMILHTPFQIFDRLQVAPLMQLSSIASSADSPNDLPGHGWQPLTLPDDWYLSGKTASQYWYRSEFNALPGSADTWAVYLPSLTHAVSVYINGIWVGQSGHFDEPVSRHQNDPLMFRFAPEILADEGNELLLRVKASYHEQGLLGAVYLAPYEDLVSAYEFKRMLRVDVIQWVTIAMYLMALVVLGFWLARRQDVVYGIFSIELFFWATHNLNLVVHDIPISARMWEALIMSTLGWTVITMVFFNHRFIGVVRPRIEKIALLCGLLGITLFLLPDVGAVLHLGYRYWDALLIIIGLYLVGFLIQVF